MRLSRSPIQHSDELPRADIFIGEMAAAATVRYEYWARTSAPKLG